MIYRLGGRSIHFSEIARPENYMTKYYSSVNYVMLINGIIIDLNKELNISININNKLCIRNFDFD